jgi:hypothetical protein
MRSGGWGGAHFALFERSCVDVHVLAQAPAQQAAAVHHVERERQEHQACE